MKQFLLNMQSLLGLCILASFTMIACNSYGKKLSFGKNEVYYKGDATEADAQKLGSYLKEGDKYFDEHTAFAVQVERHGSVYTTRLVVDNTKIKSASDIEEKRYEFIPEELSKNVFNGLPVTVEITDNHFRPLKSFRNRS